MKAFYRIISALLAAVSILLASNISLAEDPLLVKAHELEKSLSQAPSPSAQLNLARAYFYLAVDNPEYLDKAESEFKKAETSSGTSPTTRMYLATILALRADDEFWPLRAMKKADEALSLIDQTLKESPDDYELRFLRASTWQGLPSVFNKKSEARTELQKLAAGFEKESSSYPDFIRGCWADYLVDEGIVDNPSMWLELRNLINEPEK